MKTIHMNVLSKKSIENARREVQEYKDRELKEKTDKFIRVLTDRGLAVAKGGCPVRYGGAIHSINAYVDESTGHGIIEAGGYCRFIEFGTGVVGAASSHPSAEWLSVMNWLYASGGHIFTTKDGKTGWIYFDKYLGHPVFTQGQESTPFMYDAAQYLKQNYESIASEVWDD